MCAGAPAVDWGRPHVTGTSQPRCVSTGRQVQSQAACASPPGFNHRQSNSFDIGVLLFDKAAAADLTPADIAPLGYLKELRRSIRKERFTAVGYGTVRVSRRLGPQSILDNTERRIADQGFLSLQKAWLTLAMNQSTGNGGTCFGDSGGPHFHTAGGTTVIASITITGDTVCKATDKTYRMDRSWVHVFLRPYLQ